MKTLDFIFTGKPKNPSYAALESDYHIKIARYTQSQIIYLKDSPEKNTDVKNKKESLEVLKQIKASDVVVICDERGKSFESPVFAAQLEKWQVMGQRVLFVVGGAYGMSDELKARAQFKIRLSDFVFPHEMARVVLLEQVYRGMTILNGEKYHH